MKQTLIAALLFVAAHAGAATYVGSADTGIALSWPTQNSFYPSGQKDQVFITLTRTLINPYTGETRGTIQFNVGYGEGRQGTDFYGSYIRQGNHLYFYFDGKRYPMARGARLVEKQDGTRCLSIIMSTSRPAVQLCEGPIGA